MNRRTFALALLVPLMLFGMFAGGLMTWHHDTQMFAADAAQGELVGCTESADVNCDIVNTSEYSELGGVPIATFAIPFYASVLLLAIQGLRRKEGVEPLIAAAGVFATGYALFLFAVSKTQLHYVCGWCLRLYAVNAAILILGLLVLTKARPDRNVLATASGVALGLALLSVGGERFFRASLVGGERAEISATGRDRGDRDPQGDAPALSFTVRTEDARDATFTLDPDDAWTGDRDAKVAVVMFGDLECAYCKRSSAELSRLEATYGDRVLFVFKHFPMNADCNPGVKNKKHQSACEAAKASVCAKQQGVFWKFHDLTYENQYQLGDEALRTYAVDAGADGARFDACMATTEPLEEVRHDASVGANLDIHGTPRIFVNGNLYRSGSSAEVMARAIEVALGATTRDAAGPAQTYGAAYAAPPTEF